jgi:hypothetical protein
MTIRSLIPKKHGHVEKVAAFSVESRRQQCLFQVEIAGAYVRMQLVLAISALMERAE